MESDEQTSSGPDPEQSIVVVLPARAELTEDRLRLLSQHLATWNLPGVVIIQGSEAPADRSRFHPILIPILAPVAAKAVKDIYEGVKTTIKDDYKLEKQAKEQALKGPYG